MTGFNKVILMGNLTRDPALRDLPSGTPVCEIGLAVNRRWKAESGEQREEVLFVDGTAFGKRAETLAKHFKKGSPIHIEGHLKLERWEAQDGTPRSRIRVMVERFGFLDSSEAKVATPAKQNGRPAPAKRPTPRKRAAAALAPTPMLETPTDVATADIPF